MVAGGKMRAQIAAAVGLVALVLACGFAALAIAQQQQAPPAPPPDLLFKITQPGPAAPPESVTRDDLRPIPPSPDKLSDAVRFEAVPVGDPRCRPGEDVWDPGPQRRRGRSQR